jgi:hypothetical protein
MSDTTTVWTRQDLRRWLGDHFCGCGSPESAAGALLRLLRLHPLYEHRKEFEEWISDVGVEGLLLYALDRDDLTEHGGAVGGAWLTTQGEDLRAALECEEGDGFEALFEQHCIHGFNIDDQTHDCMAERSMRAPDDVPQWVTGRIWEAFPDGLKADEARERAIYELNVIYKRLAPDSPIPLALQPRLENA